MKEDDDTDWPAFFAFWRRVVRLNHPDLSLTDKLVLVTLLSYADPDGTNARPAPETLAEAARCSPKTVRRCLLRLQRAGWIRQTERLPGRSSAGLRVWRITVDEDGNPQPPGPLSGIRKPSHWDGPSRSAGRGGPVTGTERPGDWDAEAHSLGLSDHLPIHRPIQDLSPTSQGPVAPPAESAWSDGVPAPDQPPAWLTPEDEAATAGQQPTPKPSPVKSSDTPSTPDGDWPETVVLLTAALLYAPEQVARIDSRRPPSAEAVRGWLAGRMPVGASPLCGHEDRARRTARDFDADREALLDAYRLKADRGGLTVNRGGPGGLLRWWFGKGVAEAVGNARHASALRRRRSVGSTNCNAAWENRPPAKPMKFDPNWEVRP